jgi:hypothetical protein
MRKLTVKNFSVIKEAELEFGKITVLIGPQATGKSLLCKLAHFLGRKVLELAMDHAVKVDSFGDYTASVQREFLKRFPQEGWGPWNWSLEFQSARFDLKVSETATSELTSEPQFQFSEEFRAEYLRRIEETERERQKRGFLLAPALHSIAATKFMRVAGRGVWDAATYIPLERSFFIDIQKGYRALAADVDPIVSEFAIAFADSLNREIPKPRLKRFMGGEIVHLPDGLAVSFSDGRQLPINILSSGSKELLPILSLLDLYEFRRRNSDPSWLNQDLYGDKLYCFDELTIEEPEASVFPKTQYDLVREFAALSNETDFRPHFTITTHSPYILSAFNNLIEASQVVATKPELEGEVAKLIPERYWVKSSDFKAYCIRDGNLESIIDEETGLISGNYLDSVSETIGIEFDELLRLGYVES